MVVGVITQGSFAGGQRQEFAEFVRILVWAGEEEGWREVRDKETKSVIMRANSDTHSKVDIVPVSKHPRMVCLRVELLGCEVQGNRFSFILFLELLT